jgi:alcohol dehydrogenase
MPGSVLCDSEPKRSFWSVMPGIEQAGWVQQLMDILRKEGIEWVYYSGVNSNPRDFQVEQGARIYVENGADVIIAIGGGSSMDTAKGSGDHCQQRRQDQGL